MESKKFGDWAIVFWNKGSETLHIAQNQGDLGTTNYWMVGTTTRQADYESGWLPNKKWTSAIKGHFSKDRAIRMAKERAEKSLKESVEERPIEACWIRNGHLIDIEDEMHGTAFLVDPAFFGISESAICSEYNLRDLEELRYDDDYENETHPAWEEMMDIALERGAIRCRYYNGETFVTYGAKCKKALINAMLDFPEAFRGRLRLCPCPNYGIADGYPNLKTALKALKENKQLRESEKLSKRDICKEVEDFVNEAVEKTYNDSTKLSLMDYGVCIDKYGTKVFMLSGGLNGPGKWNEYLQTLAIFTVELIDKLQLKYGKDADVWLINLKNDCADDIFYPVFGFRVGEDLDETESIEWQEQNTWQADEEGEEIPFEYDECTEDWNDGN